MRYLSLFSGIEAASIAWRPLGWECVAVSEIEPFPCEVLKQRHGAVPNLGDVTKISEEDIKRLGRIDLVVFGSPCQDLSVAGKRKGLEGERSGLFHVAINIVKWAKEHGGCRFALWENVPGAFSSNKGRDFAAVVGRMAGCRDVPVPPKGWGSEGCAIGEEGILEWATLDAQWFGVAQRRRRVFALADFGDWVLRPPILLEPESLRGDSPPSREPGEGASSDTAPCLTSSGRGVERCGDTRGQDPVIAVRDRRSVLKEGTPHVARCLNAGGMGRQDFETETMLVQCVTGSVSHTLKAEGFDASEDGTGRGNPIIAFSCKDYGADAGSLSPTLRAMGNGASHANAGGQVAVAVSLRGRDGSATAELGDEVQNCLRASGGGGDKAHVLTAMQVRRLTPRECERLQGFPDDYTLIQVRGKPSADGPRYKALGNSMAVPVMRWIGTQIQNAVTNIDHLF